LILTRLLPYKTRKKLYFKHYGPLIAQVREHDCGDKYECEFCLTRIYMIGQASIDYGIDPDVEAEEMYQ